MSFDLTMDETWCAFTVYTQNTEMIMPHLPIISIWEQREMLCNLDIDADVTGIGMGGDSIYSSSPI